MAQSLKKIQGDYLLEQIQRNTEEYVKASVPSFVSGGVLISNVSLNSGANVVNHTLQRMPMGFIVLDSDAGSLIWRSDSTNRTITLSASADVTIDLWVF